MLGCEINRFNGVAQRNEAYGSKMKAKCWISTDQTWPYEIIISHIQHGTMRLSIPIGLIAEVNFRWCQGKAEVVRIQQVYIIFMEV